MDSINTGLRITIVGTGAMACRFGALFASVARVTLTGSWCDGIRAMRARGIALGNSAEQKPVGVEAVAWGDPIEPADLVLVLVKSWQTGEVARHLHRLLKTGGLVLTLQNGLGNRETLGAGACLGVTHLGATLLGPGRILPVGNGDTWVAGPECLVRLFQTAGIETRRCEPVQADGLLWGKLAVNCGINALTALLRVRNGELLERPDTTRLMRRAALECAAVAAARGIALTFPDAADKAAEVARLTAANRSSMLQDVIRGAPTELEAIYGAVVRWGRRLGVSVPVNEVLYRLMRVVLARSRRKGLHGESQIRQLAAAESAKPLLLPGHRFAMPAGSRIPGKSFFFNPTGSDHRN